MTQEVSNRFAREEAFHDAWAEITLVEKIDVYLVNEVCTAPEMRFIIRTLGNLEGKTLLDIGCGLGEASVYFALQGAKVTATDISSQMLEKTAALYNIS